MQKLRMDFFSFTGKMCADQKKKKKELKSSNANVLKCIGSFLDAAFKSRLAERQVFLSKKEFLDQT